MILCLSYPLLYYFGSPYPGHIRQIELHYILSTVELEGHSARA